MQYYSPLRYPGGKGRLSILIKDVINENGLYDGTYVEPYAGGAGLALALLIEEYMWKILINDIDHRIYSFWYSVLNNTDWLRKQIHDTPVTIDQWHIQKQIFEHASEYPIEKIGFATFFLNRTNRSGILNGGVIGGRQQSGQYKLNARYNKRGLDKRIKTIARHKNRILLYNLDANDLLNKIGSMIKGKVLFYFDPPYYQKGSLLYTNYYTDSDHAEMAELIKSLKHPWIVTYDDVLRIRDLYANLPSLRFSMTYSVHLKRSKANEIMFYKGIQLPDYIRKMKMPYFGRYNLRDLATLQ